MNCVSMFDLGEALLVVMSHMVYVCLLECVNVDIVFVQMWMECGVYSMICLHVCDEDQCDHMTTFLHPFGYPARDRLCGCNTRY